MQVSIITKSIVKQGEKVIIDDLPYYINRIDSRMERARDVLTGCDIQPSDMATGSKATVIATIFDSGPRGAGGGSSNNGTENKNMETQTNGHNKKLKPLKPVTGGGKSGSQKSEAKPVATKGKSGAPAAAALAPARKPAEEKTEKDQVITDVRLMVKRIRYYGELLELNKVKGFEKLAEKMDALADQVGEVMAEGIQHLKDDCDWPEQSRGGGGGGRGPKFTDGQIVKVKADDEAARKKWGALLGGDKVIDHLKVIAIGGGNVSVEGKGGIKAIVPTRVLEPAGA